MTTAIPFFLSRHCHQCQSLSLRTFSATCHSWSPARSSNYYDLLGVSHDATLKEIKQAFFSKSKKLHPDSDPANPSLHNQFVKLNEAYRVLSNQSSRSHYDRLRAAQRYSSPPSPPPPPRSSGGTSRGRPFESSDFHTRSSGEANENAQYWQQFYSASPEWQFGPKAQKRRQENRKIFGYCLLLMLGSMVVHYLGFRKLEELHRNFMDEKDRALTKIYNESKERGRFRRLEKQQELLRQKRAEFPQQFHTQSGQHPEGDLDAPSDPAPPPSAAQ